MRNAVRLLCLIALILLSPAVPRSAPAPQAQAQGPTIRLVLLIAVDQFRYDYLTRFRAEYTSGLNRLLTEGADFTNAFLEHYPTVTAVGHSTMMSGATPALSGIVGNDWFDRALGKSVTSVGDPETKLVGGTRGRRLLAAADAGEHGGRRAQERVARGRGQSALPEGLRPVAEGSVGGASRGSHGQRGLLLRHEDGRVRDEHLLSGGPARLGGGIQREEAGRRLCRKDVDLSRSCRGERGHAAPRWATLCTTQCSAVRSATTCF